MGKLSETNISRIGIGATPSANSRLQVGAVPGDPAYLAEFYETDTALAADRTMIRVRGIASRTDNGGGTEFWGLTGIQIQMADLAGVAENSQPEMIGAKVRVAPRLARHRTGVDDVVGFLLGNRSATDYGTMYNGTDGFYCGYDSANVGNAIEWHSVFTADTVADKAVTITRGPYDYGIMMDASVTTAALRIPNNALMVARNAANSSNISIVKVNASDQVTFKADTLVLDASGNVLANTTASNLIGGGKGIQIRSTDGTAVELNASADTAASATSAVYAKGRSGSNDVVARMQANSAGDVRVGGESSGHSLLIRQGGATRLTLAATVLTVSTDPYDIAVGTTTGTKIGTATSQKLAFWNKTPIVQPTTGITAAAFVANTSAIANDTATFGGYTIGKIAAALINVGILT